jgi:hypothetical protein
MLVSLRICEELMQAQETHLSELIANLAAKEKRAYKRAVFLTVIPIIVGAALIGISWFVVLKLSRTKASLGNDVRELEFKRDDLVKEFAKIDSERTEAERRLAIVKEALAEIRAGNKNPQKLAQDTLRNVDEPKPGGETQPTRQPPVPSRSSASPPPKPAGFLDSYQYRGADKTVITVQIVSNSSVTPKTPFTYALNGKLMPSTPAGMKFSFTLDKSKNNPTRLLLLLDFADTEHGSYDVIIRASEGSESRVNVEASGKFTKTIGYTFFAL